MNFCLPKDMVDKFKTALVGGLIDPEKLSAMTSAERHDYFSKIVGEENAKGTNALFESKLLLKNQQQGMITWAKQLAGISETARRDMVAKIERMDKILTPENEQTFLNDLASKKLGIDVTLEEATKIAEFSKTNKELTTKAVEMQNSPTYQEKFKDGFDPKKETPEEFKTRMAAGLALDDLKQYISSLKPGSKTKTFKEIITTPSEYLKTIAETSKSVVASIDDSFFGNQGLSTLLNPATSGIWVRRFIDSFSTIGKSLKGEDPLRLIRADAYSRPDALNGTYAREKLAIGLRTEEAIPTELPQRIPGVGRLFKSANDAYNGAALSLRVDLMDKLNAAARKAGVDLTDPAQAEPLGRIINSGTGRGSLGVFEPGAPKINAFIFSAKLAKGTFDTLTAHILDPKIRDNPFARKQAAIRLMNMAATYYGLVAVMNGLNPGSMEGDPRAAHFGEIKHGNSYTNILGPFRPMARTMATLIPTFHDGKLGFWRQDAKGNWAGFEVFPDKTGKYGQITPLDIMEGFVEGKASPLFGLTLTHWRGRDFNNKPPTPMGDVKSLLTPITLGNYFNDAVNPKVDQLLINTIANVAGFNSNTPTK